MTIKQDDFFIFFQVKLGLIIDLTNTTRFYDKTEVERAGIKHVKMNCKGLVKYLYYVCHFSSSLLLTCIHKKLKIQNYQFHKTLNKRTLFFLCSTPNAGVSVKIEVASRFQQSNQLYQQSTFSRSVWGHAPSENFKIAKP